MPDCLTCHKPMPAQSGPGGRRRYHEDCPRPRRSIDRRDRKAPVVPIKGGRSKAPPAEPKPRRTLTAAVLAELAAAGREDTPDGLAALQLAETIDGGGWPASSAKALHEALREARSVALAGTSPTADVIDLIFEREA